MSRLVTLNRRRPAAVSRMEIVVAIGLTICLASLVFMFTCRRSVYASRIERCKAQCRMIGQAVAQYRNDNSSYFPYVISELPQASSVVVDAGISVGAMYPAYIDDASLFRCPSTEDQPNMLRGLSSEERVAEGAVLPSGIGSGNLAWVLRDSSYGYDCRVGPRVVGNHAFFGDMDGSYAIGAAATYQNHEGYENILYVDGHVAVSSVSGIVQENNCSNDPHDNIFVEDSWSADTDSYLVRNTAVLAFQSKVIRNY